MLFTNDVASARDPATNNPKPLASIATATKLDFDMCKLLKEKDNGGMPNASTAHQFLFAEKAGRCELRLDELKGHGRLISEAQQIASLAKGRNLQTVAPSVARGTV
jgi:hypothetical protein